MAIKDALTTDDNWYRDNLELIQNPIFDMADKLDQVHNN